MAKAFPNTGATVIDSVADLPAASADLEGVMVFQKDSNELKICNGFSWVSVVDTDRPPALSLIVNYSFSNVSGVDFDGIFSSDFTNYRFLIAASHTASAGTINFNAQMRVSNSTYSGSTYDYASHSAFGDASASTGGSYNQASFVGAAISNGTNAGSQPAYTTLDIFAPNLTKWTAISGLRNAYNQSPNQFFTGYYGGVVRQTTAYDGIRFSGAYNVTGNISIYGYRI